MYNPRIALVAEGQTDRIVVEAALKAVLARPFVLTLLQPEATQPRMGTGWGGVFKWCQAFRLRGMANMASDPTLSHLDLVIVHLDVDVAHKHYADCGPAVAQAAQTLQALPCAQTCPPPSDTVAALEQVLLSWLGLSSTGPKCLFCLPSKATEAWLAAAILPNHHHLLNGLECNLNITDALSQLPKALRIKKTAREYTQRAGDVTAKWAQVKTHCTQAVQFEQHLQSLAPTFPL